MTTPRTCCVLIPYYNAGDALVSALQSLLPLPTGVDVLVVDDGSRALPAARVVEHEPALRDLPSIRVVTMAENSGIEHALNRGLVEVQADYEYIARLDCGDVSLPGRLGRQLDFLTSHPEVVLVGSWVEFVDPGGRPLYVLRQPTEDAAIRRAMRVNAAFTHPAVMFRTAAAVAVGGYPVDRRAAEDFALFWSLLGVGEGHNLAEVLTRCEINPNGISNRSRRVQLQSRVAVLRDNFTWSPLSVYGILRAMAQWWTPRGLSVSLRRTASIVQRALPTRYSRG